MTIEILKRYLVFLAASTALAVLLSFPSSLTAQVAPNLGYAAQFGVLGNSAVTGSTGSGTVVTGDVGSYPNPTISNFPPSRTVAPYTVHVAADATVQQAHTDAQNAYTFLANQGGTTLNDNLSTNGIIAPGVYSLGAADLPASTTLTLNGAGIFIFNVASSLTMNVSSVINGSANPCNVYWRVGSSATLNGTTFLGTAIASASITVGGGLVTGRVLAGMGATGAVTMPGSGGNTIGGCSTPQLAPPTPPPSCPVLGISPGTLESGTVNVAYLQTVLGNGGKAPYTFSVSSGTLPPGLTLTSAGVLAGTPTVAANYTWQIRATDANGCATIASFTITIAVAPPPPPLCPVITLGPTLPNGTVGVAYLQTILGSGGTGPYKFGVTAGALPTGLTLTSAGVLAGTPVAGTSSFTIRGTDANGCFASVASSIVILVGPPPPPVCAVITVPQTTLPAMAVGVPYSTTITASGGTAPYLFGVTVDGALPPGMLLTPAGVLSGTPTTAGTSTFTIRVTDASGCFATLTYVMVIPTAVPTLPEIFVVLLALALAGVGYNRLRWRARAA